VENSNTYTLTNVTRESTGEYKCSLVDSEDMAASLPITVECKEIFKDSFFIIEIFWIVFQSQKCDHLCPVP